MEMEIKSMRWRPESSRPDVGRWKELDWNRQICFPYLLHYWDLMDLELQYFVKTNTPRFFDAKK